MGPDADLATAGGSRSGVERRALAGRWIVRGAAGRILGVGATPAEARRRAAGSDVAPGACPAWVSPHPPHLALPAWPLEPLRELLDDRPVWLAGGPVRDLLLQRAPDDWDFVLDPQAAGTGGLQLARTIANRLEGAYYPLDVERGTGRALLHDPCSDREVTLDFAELRAPDLEGDLWARDFTLNAMAMTLDGEIIDPTGGMADLAARRLRVTQPGALAADPVRRLRAVRLAQQFGFTLAPETRSLIVAGAASLRTTAVERVHAELRKLMALKAAAAALDELAALDLLPYVLPALVPLRDRPAAWQRTLAAVTATHRLLRALLGDDAAPAGAVGPAPAAPSAEVAGRESAPTGALTGALAAAAAEIGPLREELAAYLGTEIAAGVGYGDLLPWAALLGEVALSAREAQLEALRFANRSRDAVLAVAWGAERLAAGPMAPDVTEARPTRREVYRYYRDVGPAGAAAVLVALARTLADGGPERPGGGLWAARLTTARVLLGAFLDFAAVMVDPPPLLTGRDLMAMGVRPGPAMGELLRDLREAQAAGDVGTREAAQAFIAARAPERRA